MHHPASTATAPAEPFSDVEARFRQTMEAGTLPVAIANPTTIFEANDAFLALVGHTRAQLSAGEVRIDRLVAPEYLALNTEAGQELLASGTGRPIQIEIVRRDGTHVPVLVSGTLIEREPPRGGFLFVDLSGKRAAERRSHSLVATYRALVDSALQMMWLNAPTGDVLFFNQYAYDYTGRSAEELAGVSWLALMHPDDVERVRAVRGEGVARAVRYEVDARFRRADGAYRWHHFRVAPLKADDGTVLYWTGSALDVDAERAARAQLDAANAALQASEARLRSVFEQAPVAVAVLEGPEHVYTIVSPLYAESPGAGRPLLGRRVREAFPEIEGTGYFEVMDRVYETGDPFFAGERSVFLFRGGTEPEERFFNVGYQPLREVDGRVYAIASVSYDVTEQVRARRELEAAWRTAEAARTEAESARREAETANRARADFLAIMSHELRTPLNAIGGYAELIEMGVRGPVTDAQREDLLRIQRSQRHLLGLVNEVLNYAKLEAGSVRYDLADVPVLRAVTDAEGLVAPQARAKGLGLGVGECPPDLAVRADPEKLRQVLVNLLSNAVKFTSRGGATIHVACDDATGMVAIRVRDSGIGIAADQLERIFEPFVQVRSDLTRPQEGAGLGLAISRDLARGMGGDLTAESTPRVGSTFTLTLPAA